MSWTERAKQLLRLVDPEARRWPIYVIDVADLEAFDPRLRGGRVLAWTSPVCDLLVRDYLASRGEWHGRGFCTLVDRSRFHDDLGAIAISLHEYSHFLESCTPSDSADDLQSAQVRDLMLPDEWADPENVSRFPNSRPDLPPWYQHEQRFVMAASILAYRAGCFLPRLFPAMLGFSSPYYPNRFDEHTWMRALVPMLFARGPVRELIKLEPPDRFKELYAEATAQASTASEVFEETPTAARVLPGGGTGGP